MANQALEQPRDSVLRYREPVGRELLNFVVRHPEAGVRDSVHDNYVYAQAVDHERCRVVLHTVYPHVEPPEYTDIVFDGVVVHHFEQQKVGGGPVPANVLFDAQEAPAREVLEAHVPLLERLRKFGWPVFRWSDLDDLAGQLAASGAKCFDVHGTCGLDGFVFAASMVFRRRQSRAEVTEAEPSAAADPARDIGSESS